MKYVLLFVEPEQYARDLEAMDPADRERAFMLVGQWFVENAGRVTVATKLRPRETATTVRRGDDGEHVVVDGPFVEGKEVVSGIVEIEADDLDEVLAIAKSWPGCPVVEIRPVES